MKEEEPNISLTTETLAWALCFELGLGILALLAGRFTTVWPVEKLQLPPTVVLLLLGIVSALPPLLIMVGLRRATWEPLRSLTEFVNQRLAPMFSELSVVELLLLSLAAGWGEELLFRGLIQAEIAQGTTAMVGILMASFVFALVHFITPAYFVMAFFVSNYFGWLFWQFDSLWIPIISHAAYDFLMLLYLRQFVAEHDQVEQTDEASATDANEEIGAEAVNQDTTHE